MGEVDRYLDTSFLVALLTHEPSSPRAEEFARENSASLSVSDFAAAEFASMVSRRVRMREFTREQGRFALATLDDWLRAVRWVELSPVDIALATTFLRRLDLTLRTPDAIHIAIARRLGATLVTFDRRMAAAAGALGAAVAEP